MKPLTKCQAKDAMLGGVCGGIAEYVRIDSVFIRLAFALMLVGYGTGLLIYILLWMIMPNHPKDEL